VNCKGTSYGGFNFFNITDGSTISNIAPIVSYSSNGDISAASLNVAAGTISGGSLNVGIGNINGGSISGMSLSVSTTISGASLNVGGGVISGGSLNVGGGAITGGAISGASLNVGSGAISGGSLNISGPQYAPLYGITSSLPGNPTSLFYYNNTAGSTIALPSSPSNFKNNYFYIVLGSNKTTLTSASSNIYYLNKLTNNTNTIGDVSGLTVYCDGSYWYIW
jgi:hypothetical protein